MMLNRSVLASRSMRTAQTRPVSSLKDAFKAILPEKKEQVARIKKDHGEKIVGKCSVNSAFGGMRGLTAMVYDTSLLDANEGIRFRGLSIPECQKVLTKVDREPLPEALLWLLTTGKVPTDEETKGLIAELQKRAKNFPSHVSRVLKALPSDMHPMTQFTIGINSLQTQSKFAAAYQDGENKAKYWEYVFEDMLDLVAQLPRVAAEVYRNTYRGGSAVAMDKADKLDWAANFSHMIGYDDPLFYELMRLYMTIHSDHEGGNVSAHTSQLVHSALSDPYLSLAAAMNGLAGPLHGLANQEVLRWMMDMQSSLGASPTKESVTKYCWDTLNAGKVIPGFGHAVLRKTDPRYMCQREFALKHMPKDPLIHLTALCYDVIPEVLTQHGKTANPWPNVDAHSGVLLQYFNMKEENFYTVLFGVSRALGVLPAMVWARALGFPIERPKSVTIDWIDEWAKKQQ